MKPPLTTREERLAFFQQWFSDTIPHSRALGIRIVDARRGFAAMRLEWRPDLVGNPETGVLAGGPLTALLDGCCGMAVATMLKEPKPFATLDLRIDYVKPATPGQAVIAEAECYRVTHSVAFTRAFAHPAGVGNCLGKTADLARLADLGEALEQGAHSFASAPTSAAG